jgi:alkaline phosphatase D
VSLSRRDFLLLAAGAPAIVRREAARPAAEHAAVGDVSGDHAVVWSRSDRPARLVIEYATVASFQGARRAVGPPALAESDWTARVELTGLPPGQRIVYRAYFEDLADSRIRSRPVEGSFRTPPRTAADVLLAWSADTVGQGWGIDRGWGGLRMFETLRRADPDVFVHCGDTIYADQPLPAEVPLDEASDGTATPADSPAAARAGARRVWRNVVTEAKSRVAESLEDFRGNYRYNLLDAHYARFVAEVPQVTLWDDHEVRDNWYPGQRLERDRRYRERSIDVLAARARRAFLEYAPVRIADRRLYRALSWGPLVEIFALDLRSYRGPNSENRQPRADPAARLLGRTQLVWLESRLRRSRAVWKVIAASMPIGLVVPDGPNRHEGIANGDDGPPLGRELEIARLLAFIREQRVRNVVWITGDVHYAAAHRYHPDRARFRSFDPFWEFVAGPAHAGTFGPNAVDATFGPEVVFLAIPPGMRPNRPPSAGLQFFGTLRAAASGTLTVGLHDLSGRTLYRVELEPEPAGV